MILRYLLIVVDFSCDDVIVIFDDVDWFVQVLVGCDIKKLLMLWGWIVVMMFYENFICIWVLFEVVGKWMSVDVINVSVVGFLVGKGELLWDIVLILCVVGVDVLIICYFVFGVVYLLVQWIGVYNDGLVVINVGDGIYEYFMQVLFDVLIICQCFGGIEGWCIVIVGDILYSWVVCFNVMLLDILGVEVVLVVLFILLLVGVIGWLVIVFYDFDVELFVVDVVLMLWVQVEWMNGGFFLFVWEYLVCYGLIEWCQVMFFGYVVVLYLGLMVCGMEIIFLVVDLL